MDGEENNVNVGGEGENGSPAGPVIGIIVILAIIILGGLYFWSQREVSDTNLEGVIDDINMQSDADDASSIEADLDATDIENLDAELNAS